MDIIHGMVRMEGRTLLHMKWWFMIDFVCKTGSTEVCSHMQFTLSKSCHQNYIFWSYNISVGIIYINCNIWLSINWYIFNLKQGISKGQPSYRLSMVRPYSVVKGTHRTQLAIPPCYSLLYFIHQDDIPMLSVVIAQGYYTGVICVLNNY